MEVRSCRSSAYRFSLLCGDRCFIGHLEDGKTRLAFCSGATFRLLDISLTR